MLIQIIMIDINIILKFMYNIKKPSILAELHMSRCGLLLATDDIHLTQLTGIVVHFIYHDMIQSQICGT